MQTSRSLGVFFSRNLPLPYIPVSACMKEFIWVKEITTRLSMNSRTWPRLLRVNSLMLSHKSPHHSLFVQLNAHGGSDFWCVAHETSSLQEAIGRLVAASFNFSSAAAAVANVVNNFWNFCWICGRAIQFRFLLLVVGVCACVYVDGNWLLHASSVFWIRFLDTQKNFAVTSRVCPEHECIQEFT